MSSLYWAGWLPPPRLFCSPVCRQARKKGRTLGGSNIKTSFKVELIQGESTILFKNIYDGLMASVTSLWGYRF